MPWAAGQLTECQLTHTPLSPSLPSPVGGAASLWDQGGEAQPLPGAAGALPPEAAARGGSRRQGAHQEEPGEVQHPVWEDQGDGLQGEDRKWSLGEDLGQHSIL